MAYMGVVNARYSNANGKIKEITWYMGMCGKNEVPDDFVDPNGMHWWLEGTEEPEMLSVDEISVVKDIEEIMKKYGSNS